MLSARYEIMSQRLSSWLIYLNVYTYVIEHFEEFCARLVYSADDGPPSGRQGFEEWDALETWGTVQATEM